MKTFEIIPLTVKEAIPILIKADRFVITIEGLITFYDGHNITDTAPADKVIVRTL